MDAEKSIIDAQIIDGRGCLYRDREFRERPRPRLLPAKVVSAEARLPLSFNARTGCPPTLPMIRGFRLLGFSNVTKYAPRKALKLIA